MLQFKILSQDYQLQYDQKNTEKMVKFPSVNGKLRLNTYGIDEIGDVPRFRLDDKTDSQRVHKQSYQKIRYRFSLSIIYSPLFLFHLFCIKIFINLFKCLHKSFLFFFRNTGKCCFFYLFKSSFHKLLIFLSGFCHKNMKSPTVSVEHFSLDQPFSSMRFSMESVILLRSGILPQFPSGWHRHDPSDNPELSAVPA